MPPKKRRDADDNGDGRTGDKRRRKSVSSSSPEGSDAGEEPSTAAAAVSSGSDDPVAAASSAVIEGDKESGELLIAGGTNWDLTGRKQIPKGGKNNGRNLWSPHRLSTLKGIVVRSVISGPMSCHSAVITVEGKVYSWGRNDTGQLGHGDTVRRDIPTLIDSLTDFNIVKAACGKGHTLFLTDRGVIYSVGCNASGQLGIGNQSPIPVTSPSKLLYKGPPIKLVTCGADFSAVVDVRGNLYTFGNPEYGQLGHNSDGKYFVSNSKLAFDCKVRPQRVMVFIDKTKEGQVTPILDVEVEEVACGQNHMVALDTNGRVFTWGFGGYGRLGHSDTKDELVPRLLKFFDGPNRGVRKIAAGSTFTMAISKLEALYLWGQNKNAGEAAMYPKPVHDLSGWKIRSLGCCHKSVVVAADNSVVSWGSHPTYGELGYGDGKAKSSTVPQEVKPLDGIYVSAVGCGWGHVLYIARNSSDEDKAKIEALPEYQP